MSKHAHDSIHWHISELTSRIVAKSGIPSDRHHLGKVILQSFKDAPDFIMQIDGATGESETNRSALDRSVRCAIALKDLGLRSGDVMILMAPNHIHLCIPHYAALYLGIKVAAIDATLGVLELELMFNITQPNIIFCQSQRTDDVDKALQGSKVNSRVVTFDEGSDHLTLTELLRNVDVKAVEDFQPEDFDPENTIAYLTSTSGTTGLPKTAMLTHKNLMFSLPYVWVYFSKFPLPTKMTLVVSHLQWLTAGLHFLFAPVVRSTRLQTSAAVTADHFAELVNKYQPTYSTLSPNLMTTFTTVSNKCDFTSFECIVLGGSAVAPDLITELKRLIKSDRVFTVYGLSELSGIAIQHDHEPPSGSAGTLIGALECRLVGQEKNIDVTAPNVPGELWLRGPTIFKGYYNNPGVTQETLTEDGWFKTGDIFYRDQYWNLYFVERSKLLLKYRNHQISPLEVEAVIQKHPGVLHVVVTGVPDKECGDLVVACVVPKPGFKPSAQEIQDLVKENLTDSKQIRGGVVFMEEFPLTSTSKINRKKLTEMVLTLPKE